MHFRTSLHSPLSPSGVLQKLIDGRGRKRLGTIPVCGLGWQRVLVKRETLVSKRLTLTRFSVVAVGVCACKACNDKTHDESSDDLMTGDVEVPLVGVWKCVLPQRLPREEHVRLDGCCCRQQQERVG